MADEKAPEVKTKTYTLKEGRKHSDAKGDYLGGTEKDQVELTDTAYEAFKDKFEAPTKKVVEKPKDPPAPGAPGSTIPK